jgi:serine/threonine protein kinase
LDSFKLITRLGEGAHAIVYLAQKKDEKKLYAIKVIRKDTILEKDLLDGIIKEREVLISLDHPFIVHMRYGF